MKKLFTNAAVSRAALAQDERQERRVGRVVARGLAGRQHPRRRVEAELARSLAREHRERPRARPRRGRPRMLEVHAARGERVDRGHETGDGRQERLERGPRRGELGPVFVGVVQRGRDVRAQGVDHDPEHVVRQARRSAGDDHRIAPERERARAGRGRHRPSCAARARSPRRSHAERSTSTSCQRCASSAATRVSRHGVRRARGVDDGDLEARRRRRRAPPGPGPRAGEPAAGASCETRASRAPARRWPRAGRSFPRSCSTRAPRASRCRRPGW